MRNVNAMRAPAILLLLLVGGCGTDEGGATSLAAQAAMGNRPVVRIDWQMPERIRNSPDGVVLAYRTDPEYINPSRWPVTLDGCASRLPDAASVWTWTVYDGWGSIMAQTQEQGRCTTDVYLSRLGEYQVTVEITTVLGNLVTGSQSITLRDYLIVSIGDSIASGEGNPDIPPTGPNGPPGPQWEDLRCDRSRWAGPAQAAITLEQSDPHSSVTFFSVACSGASIGAGLVGPYEGANPVRGEMLPPQIDQVAEIVHARGLTRPIDALLISVGANDIGFAKIVRLCADPRTHPCDLRPEVEPSRLDNAFRALSTHWYPKLKEALDRLSVRATYLTEFPDPTLDDGLNPCHIVLEFAGGLIDGDISAAEAEWAHGNVVLPLRDVVTRATFAHGWRLVDGITSGFYGHSTCDLKNWFVRYGESVVVQKNENGTLHPNRLGHRFYRDRITSALQPMLSDGVSGHY